ncbi:MAG: DnaB-like helicase C-terminal domain-containing protein [Leptolyngbyaceae cyanobacterium bins.302]|nr:DnaB-like helicase C-terminal domain-containing protein [Leptolyngbyaceae cyanobacterium bins.302]
MTLELKLLDGLKRFSDRIIEDRQNRRNLNPKCLSFGVDFLDEALGGIFSNDLILYGAKTGMGKTALAALTAVANAAAGKQVHFFALEAEPNEIERRMKYQILAEMFFKVLRKDFPSIHLNYMDWHYGKFEDQLGKFEEEIELLMESLFPNLWTFYRTGEFTPLDFEKQFLAIKDQTDLTIIDHLHFFDMEDENENRALKYTVKKIRDLAIISGKPIVMVAHMRKSDRKLKQIVPGLDEFHGSSDIAKIATKAITIAPCPTEEGCGNRWPTYLRAAKCRVDGSRTKYVGLVGFNADLNKYEPNYYLGKLNPAEDEFKPIDSINDLPYWAKSARLMNQRA